MVQGGTVTANIAGQALNQNVTVTSRSGWATPPVAAHVGTVPGCSFPNSPPNINDYLGCSVWTGTFTLPSPTVVSGGPNSGYSYYASNISLSQSFAWQIHPDVSNLQSSFSLHQWGACGYLSAQQIKTNVTWHESSSVPHSHYAQYLTSLQGSNNPGQFLEPQIGTPGKSPPGQSDVETLLNNINSDTANEANLYNPSYNQSTGIFMGFVNYVPYATCP